MKTPAKIGVMIIVSVLIFMCSAIVGAISYKYGQYNQYFRCLDADAVVAGFVDAVLKGNYSVAREWVGVTEAKREYIETSGASCDAEIDREFSEWWSAVQKNLKKSKQAATLKRFYHKSIQHKGEDIIVWYHIETSIFGRTQIGIGVNWEGLRQKTKVVRLPPPPSEDGD